MKEYIILLAFCCLQFILVGCNKNVVLMIADDFRCLHEQAKVFCAPSALRKLRETWSLRQTWENYEELNTGQTEIWSDRRSKGKRSTRTDRHCDFLVLELLTEPKITKFLGQILEFMKAVTTSAHREWKLPTLII